MGSRYIIVKIIFILLGLIVISIGKFLSVNFFIPKKADYYVIDEDNFIRSSRRALFCLGLYYVLLGIVLLFINGWPWFTAFFATFVPILINIPLRTTCHKYTEPLNK